MLAFTQVHLENLRKELAAQADEIDSGPDFHVSTSYNFLLLVNEDYDENELSDLIQTLAALRPGRICIVQGKSGDNCLNAEIAYFCHQLDRDTSICSDIVRVIASPDKFPHVASLLRSLTLTGRSLTTYLVGAINCDPHVESLVRMSDSLFFDSAYLPIEKWSASPAFLNIEKLIDIQWLRLAAWREHIKHSFEFPYANGLLQTLTSIEIQSAEDHGSRRNAWMLLHWFCARLELADLKADDGCFSVRRSSREPVMLSVKAAKYWFKGMPSKLVLCFRGSQNCSLSLEPELGHLRTEFSDTDGLVVTSKFDNSSTTQLVSRFFEAGASISEYRSYLTRALSTPSAV